MTAEEALEQARLDGSVRLSYGDWEPDHDSAPRYVGKVNRWGEITLLPEPNRERRQVFETAVVNGEPVGRWYWNYRFR